MDNNEIREVKNKLKEILYTHKTVFKEDEFKAICTAYDLAKDLLVTPEGWPKKRGCERHGDVVFPACVDCFAVEYYNEARYKCNFARLKEKQVDEFKGGKRGEE